MKQLDRLEDARGAFERYLELEPGDDFHWVSLAIVNSDLGDFETAFEAYRKAEVIEPTVSLYFNWAITADRCKDKEQMAKCAASLEALSPHDPRTCLSRGQLMGVEGQVDQGWDETVKGFDAIAPDETREARAAYVEHVLRYAFEYDIVSRAEKLIAHIFAERLFTDGILRVLNEIEDRAFNSARCYDMLIEGSPIDQDAVSDPNHPEVVFDYARPYAVWAESADQAGEMALAFEKRIGYGRDLRVDEIEVIDESDEEDTLLGVVFCLPGAMLFPREGD